MVVIGGGVIVDVPKIPRRIIKPVVVGGEKFQKGRNVLKEKKTGVDAEVATRQRRRGSEQTTRTWPRG